MDTVFVSLFELIEASCRVHRFNAMSFSMRQQKLDKFCRGYKVLRPRLTKHCRGRVPGVPGGVDAYDSDDHQTFHSYKRIAFKKYAMDKVTKN